MVATYTPEIKIDFSADYSEFYTRGPNTPNTTWTLVLTSLTLLHWADRYRNETFPLYISDDNQDYSGPNIYARIHIEMYTRQVEERKFCEIGAIYERNTGTKLRGDILYADDILIREWLWNGALSEQSDFSLLILIPPTSQSSIDRGWCLQLAHKVPHEAENLDTAVLPLLITANFPPSSLILFTLMMEAIYSSEKSDVIKVSRRHTTEDGILPFKTRWRGTMQQLHSLLKTCSWNVVCEYCCMYIYAARLLLSRWMGCYTSSIFYGLSVASRCQENMNISAAKYVTAMGKMGKMCGMFIFHKRVCTNLSTLLQFLETFAPKQSL
jgi:hypothetical protein